MKKQEIKKMTKDEALKNIDKLKKDLFNFRFQKVNSQVTNPSKIGETKKTIARLKTLLRGKFVDQMVNRLSSIYGSTYLAHDQLPNSKYSTAKRYIFGATYEKQTDHRNKKVRILLMQQEKLEELAETKKKFKHHFEEERKKSK